MIRKLILLSIRCYQAAISPYMGRWCRFEPSCSEYGRQAVELHGVRHGLWLATKRICRCHPFCQGGHDPVPPKFSEESEKLFSKLPICLQLNPPQAD